MKNRTTGIALIVYSLLFVGLFVLEGTRESLGFIDADNPQVMMAFLAERIDIFTYTGQLYILMGFAVAALAADKWAKSRESSSLMVGMGAFFLPIASGLFLTNGVLRIAAPGTLLHMASYNEEWGIAGYLAVQMAGTQGLALAGGMAMSAWAATFSLGCIQTKNYPKFLPWLGLLGFVHILAYMFGPLLPDSLPVYPLYIISMFGMPLWFLLLGLAELQNSRD